SKYCLPFCSKRMMFDIIILKYFILLTSKSGDNMLQTFKQVVAYFNERDKIGIKTGLERVFNLLEKANQPEQDINGIHLEGTNGKGSTIEMVQSALVAHGYQVGVFTSPSFIGIRGHFLINGIPIEKEKMIQLVNEL